MLLEIAAYGLYQFHLVVRPCCFRTAAQASPVSGLLGVDRLAEEANVLFAWTPRGARWPAVHTRGRHREHELAIPVRITVQHRLPLCVIRTVGFWLNLWLHCHSEYRIAVHSFHRVE